MQLFAHMSSELITQRAVSTYARQLVKDAERSGNNKGKAAGASRLSSMAEMRFSEWEGPFQASAGPQAVSRRWNHLSGAAAHTRNMPGMQGAPAGTAAGGAGVPASAAVGAAGVTAGATAGATVGPKSPAARAAAKPSNAPPPPASKRSKRAPPPPPPPASTEESDDGLFDDFFDEYNVDEVFDVWYYGGRSIV